MYKYISDENEEVYNTSTYLYTFSLSGFSHEKLRLPTNRTEEREKQSEPGGEGCNTNKTWK